MQVHLEIYRLIIRVKGSKLPPPLLKVLFFWVGVVFGERAVTVAQGCIFLFWKWGLRCSFWIRQIHTVVENNSLPKNAAESGLDADD